MKSVLILGSGGREHAICKALQKTKDLQIYAIPGNDLWKIKSYENISISNFQAIYDFVKENKVDVVIVGPENALADGITDFLKTLNVFVVGPSKYCSQIEQSKIFSKQLMNKAKVPTAAYFIAKDHKEAKKILTKKVNFPIVLKSNNLAAGKGVVIANDLKSAIEYSENIFVEKIYGDNNELLIEEYMNGEEFSLICLANKNKFISLPPVCDYKRIYDHDKGPNTGGVGMFNNPHFLSKEDIEICESTCIKPILKELMKRKKPYVGILFAGIMKTGPKEFKVIEYNVRFGDPETELLLYLLKTPLWDVINNFYLEDKDIKLDFNKDNALGVVVCSKGYPGQYFKKINLNFLKKIDDSKVIIMGAKEDKKDWVSTSGRIFMYISSGGTSKSLYNKIYKELKEAIPTSEKEYLHFRNDIGERNIHER